MRPTARTGLLLLKYLKTTYRLERELEPSYRERERRLGREGKGVLQQQQ